jgi:hypothetical protein
VKAIEWTEAHAREALRRTYEIAAELADPNNGGPWIAGLVFGNIGDEGLWRTLLSGGGLDAARIDREVRRVDRLARGVLAARGEIPWRGDELVRETSECWTARPDVPSGLHMSKDPAPVREWVRTRNRGGGRRRTVVKVTTRRIRRAP